jgi:UDP-GlcNAc:undecaprenyl-phosphate GlcNAc-1-phosphate transferase
MKQGWIDVVPLVSFAATALFAGLLPPLALRVDLVDHPDGARKLHGAPVPLVGGVALAAGLAVVSFAFVPLRLGWMIVGRDACVLWALAGFFLLGLWDDLHEPPALVRFLLEAGFVAAAVLGGGLVVRDLGPIVGRAPLELGWAAFPFTCVALLGFVNAVNFLDGLDALAAGACWMSWFWFAVLAFVGGFRPLEALALAWLGALLAYVPFNLGLRARFLRRIFLGDSGALLLGSGLAFFALALHRVFVGSSGAPPAMTYAWILGYPVVDALVVMIRRVFRGRNPMHADRTHLHHLLLARGLDSRRTALALVVVAFFYGLVGTLGWLVLGLDDRTLFRLFVLALLLQGTLSWRLERGRVGAPTRPSPAGDLGG